MAIQISGTTVINDSRAITNVVSYSGDGIATQAEAEAGTNNDQLMTPLRVAQAMAAGGGSVINSIQNISVTFNSASGATINHTISSVNTAKTMISWTGTSVVGFQAVAATYGRSTIKLTSSTNVKFETYSAFNNYATEVSCQIIEFA